jgi:Na+-driven multidrug efflux pump
MQLLLVAFVLPCKDVIGKTFSNDADVQQVVASLMPISCLFMMGDAIQSQTSGSEFILSLFVFSLSVCVMCQLNYLI